MLSAANSACQVGYATRAEPFSPAQMSPNDSPGCTTVFSPELATNGQRAFSNSSLTHKQPRSRSQKRSGSNASEQPPQKVPMRNSRFFGIVEKFALGVGMSPNRIGKISSKKLTKNPKFLKTFHSKFDQNSKLEPAPVDEIFSKLQSQCGGSGSRSSSGSTRNNLQDTSAMELSAIIGAESSLHRKLCLRVDMAMLVSTLANGGSPDPYLVPEKDLDKFEDDEE